MSYNNYNRGYAEPTMTSADYMTRTYRWMALGLLITFAAAFVTATTPLFYVVNSLYLLFTIAELALVFVLSARVQNMSVGAARGVFLGYALLNGMVLSYYFLAFDLGTLVLAFLATSLYFGLMAVYGTTTHKDLSGWGPKLMMALFALIITGFVGVLFGMGFMGTVLYSGIGLVVCGLGCAPIYPNIIQDTPVNYGAENSQAAIGVQMAFAYVGSTFLPSIFGALAGVGGYGWMPYFAMGICAMMAVLFNIQKKIVETKVKTD